MIKRRLLMGLLSQFFVLAALLAQSDRGAITGTATDASGAVIPAVQVTATNVDTKVQVTATTNDMGLYSILNLPIGRYEVSFVKKGFKTYERSGITVAIAQVVELDAAMQVGSLSESVTVTAEAGILETQTADVGTNMRSKVVTDLPLSISGGRSLENFAYAITPGVEGNNWTSYIQGSPAFTKEVLIDGTSATAQIVGHIGESSPPMEAVQEFKVETSGMMGDAAATGGGTFLFTLKSGTNQFHGSAFGFLHNEALNANTWMNNYLAAANPQNKSDYRKPEDRRTVYGFSGGGPVIKNKTFVFGAWEQYRQASYVLGSMDRTVPVPDFLDGNFSALLDTSTQLGTDPGGNPIYSGAILDPATGLVFPNNIIPAGSISGVSKKIVDVYRQDYAPLVPGALVRNDARTLDNNPWFHQSQLSFKVDHNFSERGRLSGSFIWTERPRILNDTSDGVWDPTDPARVGGPLSQSRLQKVTSRAVRLSYSHNFTPSLLNVASFTYNRYRNPSLASAASGDWPSQLGFGDTGAGNFPEIGFGSAINGIWESPIGYSSSGFYVGNTFIYNDGLTWVKGRHTVTFGGEFRTMQINSHAAAGTLHFNFGNNQTGVPGASWGNQVGFGFASFLLGDVESASMDTPFDLYGRRKAMSLYVHDNYRLTSRLTLSMGLRWDVTFPFHERYGHWANFDTTATNPALGVPGVLTFAKDGNSTFETQRDWREFGPHVGLAYQITPKVVARGAYGIFFSPIGLNYWGGVPYSFSPGYRGVNEVLKTSNSVPAFNWDNGYPGQFVPGTQDPTAIPWGPVTIDPKSLSAGYVHQWNVGTEIQLSPNLRLSINYTGSRGRRLQSGDLQGNFPTTTAYSNVLESGHMWDWVWDEASAAAAGVPYPYAGYSNYAMFAVFPFPQVAGLWGPQYYVGSPLGQSAYNSLQIEVVKRTAHGLSADLSYNLSRAVGAIGSGFQETWSYYTIQDPSNLTKENQTILPYDQTHVLKGYVAYDLPFGKGRRFLGQSGTALDYLAGGWTLSTMLRYNTGSPLQVLSNNYYPDWNTVYTDLASGADFSRQFNSSAFNPSDPGAASNLYFNPQGLSNPPYGAFGNGYRYYGNLRGFGLASEDVEILKNIYFKERFRFQIRASFIDSFNRHYFDNPNTDIGSSDFGHVTSVGGSPRVVQLGARFEW